MKKITTLAIGLAGYLLPATPEHWEVLAKQRSGKGEEQSSILCRPCGKGLVVISGELDGNALPFLANILAYSQEVKR